MSKFWSVMAVLLVIGISLIFVHPEDQQIDFTDLETECRYDRGSAHDIDLTADNTLKFSGYFPTHSPEAALSYDYSQGRGHVTLNVKARSNPIANFWNNCKAVVVYDSETRSLPEGRYFVTVKHDGKQVEEKVIRIR